MKIIVDVSGLAHRAVYRYKTKDAQGKDSSVVLGVLLELEGILEDIPRVTELVICYDGGKDARKALYPQYKANRKRDPVERAEFSRQVKSLRSFLGSLPVIQLYEPGVEADDIIALLCDHLDGDRVGVITGDSDLHQLARPGLTLFDLSCNKVKPAWSPSQLVTYKAIVGDPGDNIKGITGIGPVKGSALLREYRGIKAILKHAKIAGKLGKMSFDVALETIKRNIDLIRLDGRLLTDEQKDRIKQGYEQQKERTTLDSHSFEMWVMDLNARDIDRRMAQFLEPFKVLIREPSPASVQCRIGRKVRRGLTSVSLYRRRLLLYYLSAFEHDQNALEKIPGSGLRLVDELALKATAESYAPTEEQVDVLRQLLISSNVELPDGSSWL